MVEAVQDQLSLLAVQVLGEQVRGVVFILDLVDLQPLSINDVLQP